MRVHLSRERDERGVTAVLTAVLTIVLFLFAGLAVDVSAAYTNRVQLQTATDAAALAGAKVYTAEAGTCAALAGNAALRADALAAAQAVADQNRSGQVNDEFDVDCVTSGPYEGSLRVSYGANRDTPTYFTPTTDQITAAARASAVVFVPGTERKLRPYGLCALDVPPVSAMPTGVREVKMPGQAWSGSQCPSAQKGGNWWFMTCPGGDDNGMSPPEIAEAIRNGCDSAAQVVDPQNPSNSTTLSNSLTVNCKNQADRSPFCLDADTGNSSLKNPTAANAWSEILGDTIVLPVFCALPTCTPSTVDGSGTRRVYPVFKLAAVTVCGFHLYDVNYDMTNLGDCAGNTFTKSYAQFLGCSSKINKCLPGRDANGNPVMQAPKDTIRLFLKFVQEVSGTEVVGCELGTACDGGVRQVALSPTVQEGG